MKNIFLGLILVLGFSEISFADSKVEKILASTEVTKTIAQFEIDRKVDCMGPKEHQIHWMCINGGSCGFNLDITCVSQIGTFDLNDQIIRLSIFGDANGGNVEFSPERNHVTEYKTLEPK